MALDPKELRVDYRQLMSIPIRERHQLVQSGSITPMLDALTPTQRASMFPRYYEESLPDVSGFQKAMSGGMEAFKSRFDGTNQATGETGTYGPTGGRRGSGDAALTSSPTVSRYISPIEKKYRERYPDLFADGRAGLNEGSAIIDKPEGADKTMTALGIDARQYNAFRQALANIESNGGTYDIVGGAGNHYAGAYQFGSDAMLDSARALGMDVPTREQFLKDPVLQEKFLDQYTALNHKQLMKNEKYRNMTPEEQLGVLGYAHNQGAGGANKYLKTGQVGKDAFGTAGTKYATEIAAQLGRTKDDIVGKATEVAQEELNPALKQHQNWLNQQPPEVKKRLTAAMNKDIAERGDAAIADLNADFEKMSKDIPAKISAAVDRAMSLNGLHETKDKQAIQEYLKTGGYGMDPALTAWCAAFVNTQLKEAGIVGTDSLTANSFQDFGQGVAAKDIMKGDVILDTRGRGLDERGGHVGISTGNTRVNDKGQLEVEMLSGNAGPGVVNTRWYPADKQGLMVRRANEVVEAQKAASTEVVNNTAAKTPAPPPPEPPKPTAEVPELKITEAPPILEDVPVLNQGGNVGENSAVIDTRTGELKAMANHRENLIVEPKYRPEDKLEAEKQQATTPTVEPEAVEPVKETPQNTSSVRQNTIQSGPLAHQMHSGMDMGSISASQARAYNRVGENLHRDGTSFV